LKPGVHHEKALGVTMVRDVFLLVDLLDEGRGLFELDRQGVVGQAVDDEVGRGHGEKQKGKKQKQAGWRSSAADAAFAPRLKGTLADRTMRACPPGRRNPMRWRPHRVAAPE
jgi:hypothetical protein